MCVKSHADPHSIEDYPKSHMVKATKKQDEHHNTEVNEETQSMNATVSEEEHLDRKDLHYSTLKIRIVFLLKSPSKMLRQSKWMRVWCS